MNSSYASNIDPAAIALLTKAIKSDAAEVQTVIELATSTTYLGAGRLPGVGSRRTEMAESTAAMAESAAAMDSARRVRIAGHKQAAADRARLAARFNMPPRARHV